MTASLVFIALFLGAATASVAQTHGATDITLSRLSVVPAQAAKGDSVTWSVSVQNNGHTPASVVVTFFDGGAPVADNSANPADVRGGATVIVQLSFTTVAEAPHCYSAQAPGSAPVGRCESGGHILGGTNLPLGGQALAASLGVVSVAIAAALLLAVLRRRQKS